MALDGVTISAMANEIREAALGGRVDKIYMPERDEIVLAIRGRGNNHRLLLTSNPSHPRVHFTNKTKENPMTPPLFCMVLRKHLTGGKLVEVIQPDFERILELHIEALDEMGDLSVKRLIIEIMGKHSNIILLGPQGLVLDSARRVNREMSSVREILPGAIYTRPPSKGKLNPMLLDYDSFCRVISKTKDPRDGIFQGCSGISPIMASEICARGEAYGAGFERLYEALQCLKSDIESPAPEIIFNDKNTPIDFSAVPMTIYNGHEKRRCSSVSEALEYYYAQKDKIYRMNQKTADLRKIIQNAVERAARKKDLHVKTLRDVKDRHNLKLWGELLTANIYALEPGMTSFTTQNFYDENLKEITIPLDATLSPVENAQRYFNRYNKQKRTFAAVIEQMKQNDEELDYLETVLTALSSCEDESDIEEIREELSEQGFIKKKRSAKSRRQKSKALIYKSVDGFEIHVGKNNKQNDELTLKAEGSDLWFHTKDIPGSHVLIKTKNQMPPDSTLNEAANLAAYYSKARNGSQVPVDYTFRKNVRKPSGAKPGMVIYDKHKTAYVAVPTFMPLE